MSHSTIQAPFPYFGGKSKVANEVWRRFGQVQNYVEPFCGSAAVLLANPVRCTETINDKSGLVANFWRSVKLDPSAVAEYADKMVSETDLVAVNNHLRKIDISERLFESPSWYDAGLAGWWLWGMCCWIGKGFGVANARMLPHLGDSGKGINRKLPHLGDSGRGSFIQEWMHKLSNRLRDVRVCCGDWTRVLGPSVTTKHGLTAVFLDPPYNLNEHAVNYGESDCVFADVCKWATDNGGSPLYRIAVCGYAGTWEPPQSWAEFRWKTTGGYGSQSDGRGRDNAKREMIWFSPHCQNDGELF